MTKDQFRWVAQPPGGGLTRKINEEIREAEENGYELEDKETLEKPEEGDSHKAIILLQFTKSKYEKSEEGAFVSPVDISVGDETDKNGDVNGYVDKTMAVREEIAGEVNGIKETFPNHEIVSMELDEEGRTLYLRFEPF